MKMFFLGLFGVVFCVVTTEPCFGEAPKVFRVTVMAAKSDTDRFQQMVVNQFNSVFDDIKTSVEPLMVQQRVIEPLETMLENYVSKAHYFQAAPQLNCQMFSYCSICDQTPLYLSGVFKRISSVQLSNVGVKKVLSLLDGLLMEASTTLKLHKDKDYKTPQSFHELVMRVGVSRGKMGATPDDWVYFRMITQGISKLLSTARVATVSHEKIKETVTRVFEDDQRFALQEMAACSRMGLRDPAAKDANQSYAQPPPYRAFRDQNRKRVLSFVTP